MDVSEDSGKSPRRRLARLSRYVLPKTRTLGGRLWLIAVALLLMILCMLVVAIVGAWAGVEIFSTYAERIRQLTSAIFE